jgi:hypothetical protein
MPLLMILGKRPYHAGVGTPSREALLLAVTFDNADCAIQSGALKVFGKSFQVAAAARQ